MRFQLVFAPLLTTLVLFGCTESRPAPTSPPVPVGEFCNELVDAICDNVVRCSCGATADADCRSDLAATCGGAGGIFSPEIQARVTAGTVVYSATAAGAVIARLRAQTTCDNPIVSVGWGFEDLLTFGGTLTGTLTPGTACSGGMGAPFGGECANGICTDSGGTPRCIGFAAIGAPCGMGIDAVCVDLDAPFTSLESADVLLRCNVAPGATTGTCAARLANGAACTNEEECASSRCEGSVCAAVLADGAACTSDGDCSSSFCRDMATTSVCAASATVNNDGACSRDIECVSGTCKSGVCAAGICDTFDSPSPPPP